MTSEQATIGARVKTLVPFFDLPIGSEGVIVEDYRTGVMVKWTIGNMRFREMRDGFDKKTELHYLELLPPVTDR